MAHEWTFMIVCAPFTYYWLIDSRYDRLKQLKLELNWGIIDKLLNLLFNRVNELNTYQQKLHCYYSIENVGPAHVMCCHVIYLYLWVFDYYRSKYYTRIWCLGKINFFLSFSRIYTHTIHFVPIIWVLFDFFFRSR